MTQRLSSICPFAPLSDRPSEPSVRRRNENDDEAYVLTTDYRRPEVDDSSAWNTGVLYKEQFIDFITPNNTHTHTHRRARTKSALYFYDKFGEYGQI